MSEKQVDVAIIGSGSAGLFALSKVKASGKSFVLINGGEPGTTCARVGCMPSKVLIQAAEIFHSRKLMGRYGIEGGTNLQLDAEEALEHVQDLRDTFVDRVLSNSTDNMSEEVFIEGYAQFTGNNSIEVNGQTIRADKFIIATGSQPIVPAAWSTFGDKILTTDQIFELEQLPASIAVIGLGVIGLEIGQSLARLGVEVTGFDMLDNIGGISDPEVNKAAIEILGRDFPLHLGIGADVTEEEGKLRVTAGEQSVLVDRVLASLGRKPNLTGLDLEKTGVPLDELDNPSYNPNTMQMGDLPLFLAGDVNGDRQLLHEAGDEGRIAGLNATENTIQPFQRKTPIGINFCDPNICSVGQRWAELDSEKIAVGEVKMAPVGRALIMGKNRGLIRIYADQQSGKLLGCEMICAKGENLAHLMAWAIQLNLTVGDLLQMPFYHPVIEEALQGALYDLYTKVETKNSSPITELRPM